VGHDPGQFPTPPAAGWHADPTDRHEYRYHDGTAWTDHVADQGQPGHDPLVRPQPPAAATPPGGLAPHGGQSGGWVQDPGPQPQPGGLAPNGGQPSGPAWGSAPGQPTWGSPEQPSWGNPEQPSHSAWASPNRTPSQPGAWGTAPNGTTGNGRRQPTPPGGVTFGEAVQRVLSKYVDFSGRAPRSEYWWWVLAMFGAFFAVSFLAAVVTGDPDVADGLIGLLWLGTILPSIAVGVRRLHDTDRSGWWLLIGLVPLVGGIVLLVLMATEGSRQPNQYGPPVSY
jgi:uncharacterized membrane protein YhaH (DUF805 family)